ncbi:Uncharacterised protein [Segatella copri]|nr:Uncharacterised protein [Segatella copri]
MVFLWQRSMLIHVSPKTMHSVPTARVLPSVP